MRLKQCVAFCLALYGYSQAFAGVSIRWEANLDYAPGQRIWMNGELYESVKGHRASRFDPGQWRVIPREERASFRWEGDWCEGRQYRVGDRISRGGIIFESVSAHFCRPGDGWVSVYWREVPRDDWRRWCDEGHRNWRRNHHRDEDDDRDHSGSAWREGPSYERGEVIRYHGRRFRCLQSHTAHRGAGWTPKSAPALWEELR